MVKKIRRRVEKEPVAEDVQVDTIPEDASGEPESFVADIERFAEDEFTQSIVNGLKVLYTYRKLIVAGTLVVLAGFAFLELGEVTEQEELSESATSLNRGLAALEASRGVDPTSGQPSKDVSESERDAALNRAMRAFSESKSQDVVALGGKAAAQFGLKDFANAAKGYEAAANASGADVLLKASAMSGRAAAQEDAGDLAGAAQTWSALAKLDKERFGPLAAVQQARLLIADNKPSEAQTVISTVDTMALSPFGLKMKVERLKGLLPATKQ
ncbi:MAG: hypothetical protein ACPGQS_13140 [Bradymonadia bacterium]